MTDYYRKRISVVYSSNSDYSDPEIDPPLFEWESSTVTKHLHTLVSVPTGGLTLDLSMFTAVQSITIKNLDGTNFVDVAFTYTDGAAADTANKVRIFKNGMLDITSTVKISADITLTADTASCICELVVVGT